MKIIVDERSVFTFNRKTLSIGIHTHQDGVLKGQTIYAGNIQFASIKQVAHFAEMIDLMVAEI